MTNIVRKWWWSALLAGALLAGVFSLRVRWSGSEAPNAQRDHQTARAESVRKAVRALEEGMTATRMPTSVESSPIEVTSFPAEAPEVIAVPADPATAKAKRQEPELTPLARIERDELVTKLAATGAGLEQWRAPLNQIERAWLELDHRAGLGLELSRWACYQGGCTTTVTLPDLAAVERFRVLAQNSPVMAAWKGAGFVSGPVRRSSGEIEVTWILYAPSAS